MYPAQALFTLGNKTRKVRVLDYLKNGKFFILDHNDERRLVHRDQLIFLPSQRCRCVPEPVAMRDDPGDVVKTSQNRSQASLPEQLMLW